MRVKFTFVIFVLCCFAVLAGCSQQMASADYLRIHIRAHSNHAADQQIKYEIKDLVVAYITPLVASCTSKEDVVTQLSDNKPHIETIINGYLQESSYSYTGKVTINNQFFPTRYYGEFLLPSDYYDAIIITLGSGAGDNWWCVVYPPLCFSDKNTNFKYKSKIAELLNL